MNLDATAALEILGGLAATIGLIGAAKLAPAAISVGFKWIKGAIFG
ncbi:MULTISPECIES: major capsid protein [unclassified Stenotrophomonas maltophilia group]